MKTIKIGMAQPLHFNGPEPIIVDITEELPGFMSLDEAKKFYENQAEILAQALFNSLPQGTCERLTIALLSHRVSLYRGVTDG